MPDEKVIVVLEAPVEPLKTELTEKAELPKMVIAERPGSPETGTVMVTPPGELNRVAVSIPMWKLAYTRGSRTFSQTLAVTFPALMTGAPQAAMIEAFKFFEIPLPGHKGLAAVLALILIPLSTAVAGFIHNYAELKAKRDETNPAARA